jgi:hypothetical protein
VYLNDLKYLFFGKSEIKWWKNFACGYIETFMRLSQIMAECLALSLHINEVSGLFPSPVAGYSNKILIFFSVPPGEY